MESQTPRTCDDGPSVLVPVGADGGEMQTYQDANLHPGWVDAPDDVVRRRKVSVAWTVILVGLVLFWMGAAVVVVAVI